MALLRAPIVAASLLAVVASACQAPEPEVAVAPITLGDERRTPPSPDPADDLGALPVTPEPVPAGPDVPPDEASREEGGGPRRGSDDGIDRDDPTDGDEDEDDPGESDDHGATGDDTDDGSDDGTAGDDGGTEDDPEVDDDTDDLPEVDDTDDVSDDRDGTTTSGSDDPDGTDDD